jgi:Immunity protein 26
MKKVQEGNVVSIPLTDGRFAVGVLARVETARPRKPYGIFVYFFGPYLSSDISQNRISALESSKAILCLKTSALDIYREIWKTVGRIEPWDRKAWPLPELFQNNLGSNIFYKVRLDERDLVTQTQRTRMLNDGGLTTNDLYGSGAAQVELSKKMNGLNSVDD